MTTQNRVYLDNAATSWPKPQAVNDAVDDYQRRLGAPVGRSGYQEATEVEKAVDETRALIADMIGAENPERIIFTFNGTDSLNLAIHGSLKPGDHVVTTVVEHNSVLRPLRRLEKRNRVDVTRVGCDSYGVVDPDDIRAAIRAETKMVILTHASNVTGAVQPAEEVGRIVRDHDALFSLDAAQTIGHMPVSAADLNVDLLAAPGHKGLVGPLGTGILYIRPGIEQEVECIRQGGTGSSSSSEEQPNSLPEKFESGNHNAPGIIGLGKGVEYILQRGIEDIRRHAIQLVEQLVLGLSDIPGIQIFGPKTSKDKIGVVSFSIKGQDPPSFAKKLDELHNIQARAGFHCAALMHRSLGTLEKNGTIRLSIGPFNTEEHVEAAVRAVAEIAKSDDAPVVRVSCPCISNEAQSSELVTPAESNVSTNEEQGSDITSIPGLQDLWQQTLGDPNVCIAVLDGPVDLTHPCFAGANISVLPSMVPNHSDNGPATQHGTHVASVIFGQHGSLVKGIAPKCRGLLISIFKDKDENSFGPCSQIDLARAISQAVEAGANIINVSGGQFSPSGAAHPILADVVKKCSDRGILLVAAAGNQGCECLHIPGAIPSVLAVGAMDINGDPLNFSNWGYGIEGILAPGEGIIGASPGGETQLRSGTSFATPIVSGLAGLLMSLSNERGLSPSAAVVRSVLVSTALDCEYQKVVDCNRLLGGRINLNDAFRSIKLGEYDMTHSNLVQSASHPSRFDNVQKDHKCGLTNEGILPAELGEQSPTLQTDSVAGMHDANEVDLKSPRGIESESNHLTSTVQDAPYVSPSSASNNGNSIPRRQLDSSPSILPSSCGCGGSDGPPQLVYALGKLAFDYGSRARRVSFANDFAQPPNKNLNNIDDPADLMKFLTTEVSGKYNILQGNQFANRTKATSIIWTLEIDETPIYAIVPSGAFAVDIYDTLVGFLADQVNEGAERISVPGVTNGQQIRLYTGETVPIIYPEVRGMFSWKTSLLVEATQKAYTDVTDKTGTENATEKLEQFLMRIYEDTRNLGVTSEERALNYAVTDALQLQSIFGDVESVTRLRGLEFDTLEVERSPVCREDADCWDVKLFFYDAENLNRARREFRFTVDVSDIVPIMIGKRKEFSAR